MITLDQIRQTEDKAKVNRLSEANLLSEDDRQDYIDWLNQDGSVDTESYDPY